MKAFPRLTQYSCFSLWNSIHSEKLKLAWCSGKKAYHLKIVVLLHCHSISLPDLKHFFTSLSKGRRRCVSIAYLDIQKDGCDSSSLLVGEENIIATIENSVEVNKYFDVTQWKVKENYSDVGEGREEDAFMILLINHTDCLYFSRARIRTGGTRLILMNI